MYLYLCCDFIDENSIVCNDKGNLFPILRQLNFKSIGKQNNTNYLFRIKEVYNKIIFLPCNRDEVDTMRIYLTDEYGKIPSFSKCELKCSLLLYKPDKK